MKFTEEAKVEIVFGDGSTDRMIIKEVMDKNKHKYCKLSLFLPESGVKGIVIEVITGIRGVLKFIKNDISKFSMSYIVFIDKEHCNSDCERCIRESAREYGITVSTIDRLSEDLDIYKLKCTVGNKDFSVYFIFLGFTCCIEDFILKICNQVISEYDRKGCCKKNTKISSIGYQRKSGVNVLKALRTNCSKL